MIGLCMSRVPRLVAAPFVFALLAVAPASTLDAQTVNLRQPSRCVRSNGSVENSHEERDGRESRWHIHWSGKDCSIDFRASGEVRFNAAFTDVTSVSNGGSLEITATQGGDTRRMTMTPDHGRLQKTWSVNGRQEAWNEDAGQWLAGLLIDLDRVSAAGVDYRFPSLLAKGVTTVLDEVQLMASDYPRSVYLRRLIDSTRLNDGEYQRVVAIASLEIRSDYEMSRILRAIADRASFDNAAMRQSYFDAVGRMTSDYERSRVLQAIVTKAPMSRDAGQQAIKSAGSFSSDYERGRVLLAAIDNKALEIDDVIPILEAVTKSQSDYEKSRVLLAVAGRWSLNGDTRKAYLRAADTIHSDYESRRVLSALASQETRR